jgi:hypothetical protein
MLFKLTSPAILLLLAISVKATTHAGGVTAQGMEEEFTNGRAAFQL